MGDQRMWSRQWMAAAPGPRCYLSLTAPLRRPDAPAGSAVEYGEIEPATTVGVGEQFDLHDPPRGRREREGHAGVRPGPTRHPPHRPAALVVRAGAPGEPSRRSIRSTPTSSSVIPAVRI